MSKCGKCGFDGNIGEHTILRCRTKDIPKVIYDRVCTYMANVEDPEAFLEDFAGGKRKAKVWMEEEAFDIMYELSKIYQGDEYK